MPRAVQAMRHVSKRRLALLGVRCSHPANHYEEWYYKSGDLLKQIHRNLVNGEEVDEDVPYDRTAQTDANSKLHFVLHSRSHGSNLSGYICLCNGSSEAQEVTRVILTTKGMRIRPMNAFGILNLFAVSSIESTTEQNSRFSHR
jgi:hypothetical protein